MQVLYNSKICISPFGYGEVNIREVECLVAGTPVIKPNIDVVKSTPFIYGDGFTYDCNNDYSNIKDVVDFILSNYDSAVKRVEEQRSVFDKKASDQYIVSHVIKTILN